MAKIITGVTIRKDSVTAVSIAGSVKGYRISGAARVDLASGEGQEEDPLTYALGRLKEQVNIGEGTLLVSVPAWGVSFRQVNVPIKGRGKIEQILPYELESTLPGPVESRVIRFQDVDLGKDAAGGSDLFAASVDREDLSSWCGAFSANALDPELITVGVCAILNACVFSGLIETDGVVLDMMPEGVDMAIVLGGQVVSVRHVPEGSDPAMEIRRQMISFEESLRTSFKPGVILVSGKMTEGEEQSLTTLAGNLGARFKALDLQSDADLMSGRPLGTLPPADEMNGALALTLLEVAGTDTINFSEKQLPFRKIWEENRMHLRFTAVLVAMLMLLALGVHFRRVSHLKQEIARADARMEQIYREAFPGAGKIVDALSEMKVKLRLAEKTAGGAAGEGQHHFVVDLLHEISTRIPEAADVEITRFLSGGDSVLISGNTDTFNSVDDIKTGLGSSSSFDSVTISTATMDKKTGRVKFKLKLILGSSS